MFEINNINNETEYEEALARVDELMKINPELDTKESLELESLVSVILEYENKNWNINTKKIPGTLNHYKRIILRIKKC